VLPVSLDCFSLSCVPCVASFSGLFLLCFVCTVLPVSRKTIQRNWQHRAHKTQKNNPEKLATQGTQDKEKQSKNNPEKWATQGTQDKEKQSRETGNTGHTRQRKTIKGNWV
jgi:hypothetical protein